MTETTQLSELTTEKLLQLYRTIIVKRGTEFRQSYITLESCLLEAQRRDADLAALRQLRDDMRAALMAFETDNDRLRQQVTQLTQERTRLIDDANRMRNILTDYNLTRSTCSAAWCEIDNEIERMNEEEGADHE